MKGSHCLVSKGFGNVVQQISERLDVRLEHEVTNISFHSDKVINIETKQGNAFEAKSVLVTIPVSVLKSHIDSLFSPSLSAPKIKAINDLKMGYFEKVALLFDKPFWNPHKYPNKHFFGSISNDPHHDFANFLHYSNSKGAPIIIGYVIDQFALYLSKLSEEEIISKMIKSLERIFPNQTISPIRYLISRWNSDPYSIGSYAYLPIGALESQVEDYAKPEGNNRIFFAGDGTYFEYQGCTIGSYMSGLEQANEIFKSIEK